MFSDLVCGIYCVWGLGVLRVLRGWYNIGFGCVIGHGLFNMCLVCWVLLWILGFGFEFLVGLLGDFGFLSICVAVPEFDLVFYG